MKTKKPTISSAKKKAWKKFSEYIRERDAIRDYDSLGGDRAYCYTCHSPYPVRGVGCLQAGHFIPGRNNQVLFDERQVHAQCYNCNCNLKGNWVPYLKRMKEEYPNDVDTMLAEHKQVKRYSVEDLQEIEQVFKEKIRILTA